MSDVNIQQAYAEPQLYDLEHSARESDVSFFIELAREWRAQSMLEIGCGNGRVTLPLAAAARKWGGVVTGLELSPEMLAAARERDVHSLVRWIEGDLVGWRSLAAFDLIISPCGTLGHLLELDVQLAAWRNVHENLRPGGRFVLSEPMANLAVLGESMQQPPRATVELDLDREAHGQRLIRYRTTQYQAHEQRMTVHYLYDRFAPGDSAERLATAYEGHVYFPRELQLLSMAAGLSIEAIWGDCQRAPLQHSSRQLLMVSRRPDR